MSHFGSDPGDMTQDEMHDRSPVPAYPHIGIIVRTLGCPGCQTQDGKPDADLLNEITHGCLFGCGAKIDRDTGICAHCHAHSCNAAECERCGREYEQWGGTWAYVAGTPR